MTYKTVQPVDRLSRVSAVAQYAENRKGYDGHGKKNKERPPNQNESDEAGGDKFYFSMKEQPEEFGVLLKKLVEENRQMKETVKTIYPADNCVNLAMNAWPPKITVHTFTKE